MGEKNQQGAGERLDDPLTIFSPKFGKKEKGDVNGKKSQNQEVVQYLKKLQKRSLYVNSSPADTPVES